MAKKKTKESNKEESKVESSSLFEKAVSILNEDHGNILIKSLSTMMEEPREAISTGSIALDYVINPKDGGILKGRVIELYGKYSTGKTTIALQIAANVTANKKYVIFVDAEHSLDPISVLNAGVDQKYFHIVKDRDGRKAANIIETLMKTGEVGLLIIDSIPTFKPVQDLKKGADDIDITKEKMAFQASFLSVTLPALTATAEQYGVIQIWLNQMRQNMSGYGSPDKPYGGDVQKHMASIRVLLKGNASSKDNRIMDSEGNLVGQMTTALVDKNKTYIPFKETTLPLFLGRGINPYMELVLLAQSSGLLKNASGSFSYTETGEKISGVRGADQFTQLLYDDFEFYTKLKGEVCNKLGIKYPDKLKVVNPFHDELGNKKTFINIDQPSEVIED